MYLIRRKGFKTLCEHKKTGLWAGFLLAESGAEKKPGYAGANPLAGKNDPFELVASPGVAPR